MPLRGAKGISILSEDTSTCNLPGLRTEPLAHRFEDDCSAHWSCLPQMVSALIITSPSLYLCLHVLPFSTHTALVRVSYSFWTRFDLAMMDCYRVHSSFSGHLSPHRRAREKEEWSGVSRGRMDLLMCGSDSRWCIRVWITLDVRDNFIQAEGHTFIYAAHSLDENFS